MILISLKVALKPKMGYTGSRMISEEMEKMSVFSGVLILFIFSAVCYAAGRLLQGLFNQQGKGAAHAFLTGSFSMLILFYLLQIAVVGLSLSFSVLQWGYVGICALVLLNALLFLKGELWSVPVQSIRLEAAVHERRPAWLFIGILTVLNILLIEIDMPYFGNDMTVEQAATTLATRTLYRYNPATGLEFVYGMAPIAKCNALPQFYAVLCACSGADAYPFICSLIPVWGLILNVSACSVLAGAWGLTKSARCSMLLFYLLLVLFGGYYDGAYAFRLLHQGFAAQTIFLATGGMALFALVVSLVRKRRSRVKGGEADE